jgi:hypothetical protein
MLSRIALLLLIALTSFADAGPLESKLIGKWLFSDIDAWAVFSFQPDHTCVRERTGFNSHDSMSATWQLHGHHLTVVWQSGDKITYRVAALTSDTLVLGFDTGATETWSRAK